MRTAELFHVLKLHLCKIYQQLLPCILSLYHRLESLEEVERLNEFTNKLNKSVERDIEQLQYSVRSEVASLEHTIADEQWMNSSKIISISSEVESLRKSIHSALRVVAPSENWHERRELAKAMEPGNRLPGAPNPNHYFPSSSRPPSRPSSSISQRSEQTTYDNRSEPNSSNANTARSSIR